MHGRMLQFLYFIDYVEPISLDCQQSWAIQSHGPLDLDGHSVNRPWYLCHTRTVVDPSSLPRLEAPILRAANQAARCQAKQGPQLACYSHPVGVLARCASWIGWWDTPAANAKAGRAIFQLIIWPGQLQLVDGQVLRWGNLPSCTPDRHHRLIGPGHPGVAMVWVRGWFLRDARIPSVNSQTPSPISYFITCFIPR
jgi:hypothetical protein